MPSDKKPDPLMASRIRAAYQRTYGIAHDDPRAAPTYEPFMEGYIACFRDGVAKGLRTDVAAAFLRLLEAYEKLGDGGPTDRPAWIRDAVHAANGVMASPAPVEQKPVLSISDLCARCLRDAVLTPKDECTTHGVAVPAPGSAAAPFGMEPDDHEYDELGLPPDPAGVTEAGRG